MIELLSLLLAQGAVGAPVPVVVDAPPALILAAYDQCLGREIDERLLEPISAEQVFDQSQAACVSYLDAYIAKLTSTIVMTNIDYQQERARFVADLRARTITRVTERRAVLAPTSDNAPASNGGAR